ICFLDLIALIILMPIHLYLMNMKAWKLTQYSNFDKGITQMDVPMPQCTDDEVLIQVESVSINPVDYKIADGHLKLFYKQKMPAGLAFDCSGIITKVGKNVSQIGR